MTFLLTIAVISYMLALGLVFSHWRAVKTGKVSITEARPSSLRSSLSQGLDAFAVYIVFFFREGIHHGYVYILLGARRLMILAKKTTADLERVLSKIIHSVREKKRRDGERGASSLFLQELKLHHDKIKS